MKMPEDQNRVKAMEQIDIAKKLLEEHFSEVAAAVNKGEEGLDEFGNICRKADVPQEMVDPIWKILMVIQNIQMLAWGPGPFISRDPLKR